MSDLDCMKFNQFHLEYFLTRQNLSNFSKILNPTSSPQSASRSTDCITHLPTRPSSFLSTIPPRMMMTFLVSLCTDALENVYLCPACLPAQNATVLKLHCINWRRRLLLLLLRRWTRINCTFIQIVTITRETSINISGPARWCKIVPRRGEKTTKKCFN